MNHSHQIGPASEVNYQVEALRLALAHDPTLWIKLDQVWCVREFRYKPSPRTYPLTVSVGFQLSQLLVIRTRYTHTTRTALLNLTTSCCTIERIPAAWRMFGPSSVLQVSDLLQDERPDDGLAYTIVHIRSLSVHWKFLARCLLL